MQTAKFGRMGLDIATIGFGSWAVGGWAATWS